MIHRLLCLVLLGLAYPSWALARDAVLLGTVRDSESNLPIDQVTVKVAGTDLLGKIVTAGAASSDSGDYRIQGLSAGTYSVTFGHVAYSDFDTSAQLDSGQVLRLDVVMFSEAIYMEGLVVEAARDELEKRVQPGKVTVSSEALRSIPSVAEPDPIRAIQLLPGVQAASDVSSGLYIRGGGPDQTLVLLDDVTIYNPTHAFGFFSTFNGDVVDDVTLYKGAYPASHGGRLGAVLEVNTVNDQPAKITGQGGISTIAGRLTMQGPAGKHRWLVSGRRTYLDPLLNLLRKSDPEIPSYYFWDLNGKFTFQHKNAWTTLSAYGGRDDIRFELDASTFIDIRWGNTLASVEHNRQLSDVWSFRSALSGSRYKSTNDWEILNTPFFFENELQELSLKTDFSYQPSPGFELDMGAMGSAYDFLFRSSFNETEGVNFVSRPVELSAFVDASWARPEASSFRLGLRTRYLEQGQRLLFEPRFSYGTPLGNVRLKVAGGVYHQYLQLISSEGFSAGDFYVPIDETVDPGRSYQGVVGVEWTRGPTYRFSVEGYYTRLQRLVVLDFNAPADQSSLKAIDLFVTDGTGWATGAEFFVEKRIGSVTGWIGYTLGWTRRTFNELNSGDEYPPKYDRRHDINVVFNYRRGPWRYGMSFIYATGQAFTPASARYEVRDPATGGNREGSRVLAASRNSARLLPYHRMDVSVTRDFRPFGLDAQWFVQMSNLYNRRNEWFVQYDTKDATADVINQLPLIPSIGVNFKW